MVDSTLKLGPRTAAFLLLATLALVAAACDASSDETEALLALQEQVNALEQELKAASTTTTTTTTTIAPTTTTTTPPPTTTTTTTPPATTATTVRSTTTIAPRVTLQGALEFQIPTRWLRRTDQPTNGPCPEQETYASGRITVLDSAGRTVAVGDFLDSEWFDFGEIIAEPDQTWDRVEARCRVRFAIHDIPRSDFYRVGIIGAAETYSRTELESMSWYLAVGFYVPGRA